MKQGFIALIISLIPIMTYGEEEIRLAIGEQKTLLFPGLKTIENSNPKLVRISHTPPQETVVMTALSKGNAPVYIHDRLGDRTVQMTVYSKLALDLEREIKAIVHQIEGVEAKSVGHQILLTGNLYTPNDLKLIQTIEKKYEQVINMTHPLPSALLLPMEKMVQLEVKLLELNKKRLRGIGLQFPDSITTHFSLAHQMEGHVVTSTLQATTEFDLIFKALEKKGFAKLLANPKLICKNKEEASFLAGGEIPLKLSHKNQLSVQWKPYGISLKFSPQVDSQDRILLTLEIEVSTLDPSMAIDGIPGFRTRRLETDINIHHHETIVISGLIHHEQSEEIHRVPGLSAIPILGTLFESKAFQNQESELMVFVTPTVKTPTPGPEAL